MKVLAGLYAAGRGVSQNWSLAVEWWRKAEAWRFVGDAYACGLGAPKSAEAAAGTYETAAASHDLESAIQLANMHAGGCLRAANLDVALKWYEKAGPDTGHPEAQVGFAELLLRRGPRYNPERAHFWARVAELRLPPGELRARAERYAAQAASEITTFSVGSNEYMVQASIAFALKEARDK